MKHHHIRFVYFFSALVLMPACSAGFISSGFEDFSDATDVLGKNVEYVMEQSRAEELNLRSAESLAKDNISLSDFQPKIVTMSHLESRKELIKYLTGYTRLLASLINSGKQSEFREQAIRVYGNIRAINTNHQGFLNDEEQGMIAACAAAIPEALTSAKRRGMILKIGKNHLAPDRGTPGPANHARQFL